MEKSYGNTELQDYANNEKQLPNNVFIENSDSVFEAEQNRINTLDDNSKNNNNTSTIIPNISNKFKIYKTSGNNVKGLYSVRFISINNEFPNSELREAITSGIWYDDIHFIYSVKNRGIFIYDAQNRTYKTVITGNDEFKIQWYGDNIVYYDDGKTVDVNFE